jgi:hypothetical protein
MIFVITLFGGFFYFTDMAINVPVTGFDKMIQCIYFSVVTVTTLGFGDIYPKTGFGMTLVIVEVFFGQLMFWVMMTILAKKIFR